MRLTCCAFAAALLAVFPAEAKEPQVAPMEAPAGVLMGPALRVSRLDRSLDFYTKALGMHVKLQMGAPQRRETMLGFSHDPAEPTLVLLDDSTGRVSPAVIQGDGFSKLILRMKDLDGVAARLKAAGFGASPIREVPAGYRMMVATDPDGYKLELVERTTPAGVKP